MELITEKLLNVVSDWSGKFAGAYNIRENGQCAGRAATENIDIITKTDKPGIDIKIKPDTKNETVSIPACVTKGNVDDLVYNDFYVGENADILIVAGCGVHTDTHETARHNGIHRFFLGKNSHVIYREKHIGTGEGDTAWKDEDGYYWYVGRNDDVIKASGYRIGPFEIESVLVTHPAVLECAITAAPDPIRGQVVKATVVLAKGYTASEELKKELQNHVKKNTAPYKYPRIVEFVDELPKTISGKIRRVQIRQEDNKNN